MHVLISTRATSLVFEAAEAEGLSRDDLARPLGLDVRKLSDTSNTIGWDTLVDLTNELERQVGGDVEWIRRIGRRMPLAPAYDVLQRIARVTFSLRGLYVSGERWMIPAMFPHVVLMSKFEGDRMRIHMEIPEPYTPSAPFFHISEGAMSAMPMLLGLPPAELAETRVTPRSMDAVFVLPRQRSLPGAGLRALRSVVTRSSQRELELSRQINSTRIESLQHAYDEFRGLLERLPDMVLVHASERILWVNRALVKTLGYDDANELVGTPLPRIVAARSIPTYLERIHRPAESMSEADLAEMWLLAKDGSSRLVEITPAQGVVFGGIRARLVVGRDVTERVRMQQQLVTADRLASIGLLAAGVAHEVNNPLAYILNNIEMAQRQLAGLGPQGETSRHALATALEGVDRIRFIVRELLVLARGDSGASAPTDVVAAVESTLLLAKSEISRNARLVREFGPVPLAFASTGRISQVILNLVLNAIQSMRETDPQQNVLTLRLGTVGATKEPGSSKDGNDDKTGWVSVEVSDTGVGIAPDALQRIFDPFYTTNLTGQGTGLGLAISQRLIAELGGEIEVTSAVGKGSTFRVLLPPAPRPTPR